VAALASLDGNKLAVCVWHYHDEDVPGPEAEVSLMLNGLPDAVREATLSHYRIDHDHSNAFTVWQRMGKPATPTAEQYAELEKAGQLSLLSPPSTQKIEQEHMLLRFPLPRQAVSLLVLEWPQKA
jgi:xylan 1,4-beta-xylosidase